METRPKPMSISWTSHLIRNSMLFNVCFNVHFGISLLSLLNIDCIDDIEKLIFTMLAMCSLLVGDIRKLFALTA